jgi:hypothetical protein
MRHPLGILQGQFTKNYSYFYPCDSCKLYSCGQCSRSEEHPHHHKHIENKSCYSLNSNEEENKDVDVMPCEYTRGNMDHTINQLLNRDRIARGTWYIMHAFSFCYPDNPTLEEQQKAYQFYESIGYMFPCDNCKRHYLQMFYKELPFVCHTREALSQWVVNIHNTCNNYNKTNCQ